MAAKRKKRKHRRPQPEKAIVEGLRQNFIMVEADNPFAYGDGNPHQKIKVTQNRLTHPCVEYCNRNHISVAQMQAGLLFEKLYVQSGASPQAMNPMNEPVDGGGAGDAFTDHRMTAIQKLIHADRALGRQAYLLIEQVCGHGVYVSALSRNTHETGSMMRNLKTALDILSEEWGFAGKSPARH